MAYTTKDILQHTGRAYKTLDNKFIIRNHTPGYEKGFEFIETGTPVWKVYPLKMDSYPDAELFSAQTSNECIQFLNTL